MRKTSKSTIVLVIIFFVGLSLLLYPPLSSYWNSFHQSRAIASYIDAMNQLDNDRYDQLLDEARIYNAALTQREKHFDLSDAEVEQFMALLGGDGTAVGYIEIPSIKVQLPIYLGTSEAVLQVGVGVLEGGSIPVGGESTHAVLTGHRGLPSSTLFTHLDRVVEGDIFTVHILDEAVTYEVDQIKIVEPHEMDDLTIQPGQDLCTLVTCTPYGINTHRMLVRGHRVDTPEDMLYRHVSADALQIEPMVVAVLVAVPMLLILLLLLVGAPRRQRSSIEEEIDRSKNISKGGSSDEEDQKTDR